MKAKATVLATAIVAILASPAAVTALQKSRLIVFLTGERTESNDILFDYSKTMDLSGIANLEKSHPKEPIPFEKLIGKLPGALQGWVKGPAYGMSLHLGVGAASFATCSYTREEAQVTVSVWDTMNLEEGPWTETIPAGNADVETPDGYVKFLTIEGYPSCELRTHAEKSGTLCIALAAVPVPEACWIAAGLLIAAVLGKTRHRL